MFEPVCLEAFNDARECLFQTDGQVRLCENELNLFEECQHDPIVYSQFVKMGTLRQRRFKDFTWYNQKVQNLYH